VNMLHSWGLVGRAHPARPEPESDLRRRNALLGEPGNVGSSIYFALGVVAEHGSGLTPLIFVAAGLLVVLNPGLPTDGLDLWASPGVEDAIHATVLALLAYAGIEAVAKHVRKAGSGVFFAAARLDTDAIVLGAEPSSPIRGGSRLGGVGLDGEWEDDDIPVALDPAQEDELKTALGFGN
jgi:hypothetical protein